MYKNMTDSRGGGNRNGIKDSKSKSGNQVSRSKGTMGPATGTTPSGGPKPMKSRGNGKPC